MTRDAPRFYLHMGMGKTGSSALQVAFLRNQDALTAANTIYPASQRAMKAARSDRITSGNGGILRPLLMKDVDDQGDAWTTLMKRVEDVGSHHVLFSSEVLFKARPKNLEQFREFLDQSGWHLHPILYVRNIAGHAVSSYGQRIKRSRATDTLSKYCTEKYRPNYRSTLEKLLDVVAESDISVVHYDSEKENLFAHFLHEVLEAPPTTKIDDPVARKINRSLTRRELAILRRVNSVAGTRAGVRLLTDSLLGEFPNVHEEKSIPRDVVSVLHDRFEDEVGWVNRVFFDDSRLTVASSELAITDDDTDMMDLDPMQRVLLGLVAGDTVRTAK